MKGKCDERRRCISWLMFFILSAGVVVGAALLLSFLRSRHNRESQPTRWKATAGLSAVNLRAPPSNCSRWPLSLQSRWPC